MRLSIVFLLILSTTLITGCASKAQNPNHQIDGFSYVEGDLIYIDKGASNPLVGRLVYYPSGVYFLKIQHEKYYRGLRKSYTSLSGEKLNSYVSENSLLPGAPFGGGINIRLTQQQVELAINDNFRARNIDHTGRTIDIKIPADYAREFMDMVYLVDPTLGKEPFEIELAERAQAPIDKDI